MWCLPIYLLLSTYFSSFTADPGHHLDSSFGKEEKKVKQLDLSFLHRSSGKTALIESEQNHSDGELCPTARRVLTEAVRKTSSQSCILARTNSELDIGPHTPDKYGRKRRPSIFKDMFTRKLSGVKTPEVSPKGSPKTGLLSIIRYNIILGDLTREERFYKKAVAEQVVVEQKEGRSESSFSPRLEKYRKMLECRGVLFAGVPVQNILKEELFSLEDYKETVEGLYEKAETKDMDIFNTIESIFEHGVSKYLARAKAGKRLKSVFGALETLTASKNKEVVRVAYDAINERADFITVLKKLSDTLNDTLENEKDSEQSKKLKKIANALLLLVEPESSQILDSVKPDWKKEDIASSLEGIHYNIDGFIMENIGSLKEDTEVIQELLVAIREYKNKRAENRVTPVTIVNIDELMYEIEELKNTDNEKAFSLTPPAKREKMEEEEFFIVKISEKDLKH